MKAAFRTSITRLLGIQTPVISAAMTGPSGGLLAAAVTKAGGFGFLSAGRASSVDHVLHQIRIARVLLPVSSSAPLPIGVGFFGFELDVEPRMIKILDSVLLQGVQAIWLSFGMDLGKWIGKERIKVFVTQGRS